MRGRHNKVAVQLFRNTTWRCGRIQKCIVLYLRKKVKPVPLTELIAKFSSLSLKGKEGIIRAVVDLAKRNIVLII